MEKLTVKGGYAYLGNAFVGSLFNTPANGWRAQARCGCDSGAQYGTRGDMVAYLVAHAGHTNGAPPKGKHVVTQAEQRRRNAAGK